MKYKLIYFLISLAVIGPGLYFLLTSGLKPSIDFTGGTLWEIRIEKELGSAEVKEIFAAQDLVAEVQSSGEKQLSIKTVPLEESQHAFFEDKLKEKAGDVEEIRYETLGPRLGAELLRKALIAVVLATVVILLYVAFRFKNLAYGTAAILAMFHDTLVLLGVFAILGYFFGVEVDTLFVTAVLTTLSFSVHDTIVVFDRIREIHSKGELPYETVSNQAIEETLVRSLNNSLTIIFMLVALMILGGETLRVFTGALLVGTITGTFSSTFNAVPLLAVWEKFSRQRSLRGILRLR
ncbi:MAG: protein translocase subunit SecF [Patescibacteria group bacterium]